MTRFFFNKTNAKKKTNEQTNKSDLLYAVCCSLLLPRSVSVLQEGTPTLNNTKTTNWLNKKVIADSLYSHAHKSS